MSITKLELARSDCEAIETSEKVLAMALQQKRRIEQAKEGKDASFAVQQNIVWWDLLIKRLSEKI